MNHKKLLAFVLSAALTLGTAGAVMAPAAQAASNSGYSQQTNSSENIITATERLVYTDANPLVLDKDTFIDAKTNNVPVLFYGNKSIVVENSNAKLHIFSNNSFIWSTFHFADDYNEVAMPYQLQKSLKNSNTIKMYTEQTDWDAVRPQAVEEQQEEQQEEQVNSGVNIITATEKLVYTNANPLVLDKDTFIDAKTNNVPVLFDGDKSIIVKNSNAKLHILSNDDYLWLTLSCAEQYNAVAISSYQLRKSLNNSNTLKMYTEQTDWDAVCPQAVEEQQEEQVNNVNVIIAEKKLVYTDANPLVLDKDTFIDAKTYNVSVIFEGEKSIVVKNSNAKLHILANDDYVWITLSFAEIHHAVGMPWNLKNSLTNTLRMYKEKSGWLAVQKY